MLRRPPDSEPVAPAALAAPPHFGRFLVLERAGAGAMGVVYAAYDPSLDRRVALKVLRGAGNTPRERDRARREALALARVNHPNVVSVFEVGETDGRVFIAMEYVDGPHLAAWLAARTPDWRQIVETFITVGGGLAAAHDQGLVHRDFKPGNVLVGPDGRPRIIDFGLARAADGAPFDDGATDSALLGDTLTRTGRLMGTPAYMAPEQLDGGEPTPASDQFAFCVALFEMLHGAPPFVRDSLPMLRLAIARGAIAVPEHSPVPPGVVAVIRRGLAASPAARWPSMDQLLVALADAGECRPDPAAGWRARAALAGAAFLIFAAAGLRTLRVGPPTDPQQIVLAQLAITAAVGAVVFACRRWFAAEELNRRLRTWLLLFVLFKLVAAALGARLGASVQQIFAVDAVVMAGVFAFAEPYIGLRSRAALGAMLAAIAGIAAWPAFTIAIHHVAGLLMILGILRSEWALRQTLRSPSRSGPRPA
ncbi:MAG: serine/threonine protein kinase [Deltaproteobacteria bacterium]|nr:serine/threonine protein kinase [Deltaproteobacteria bacterium]